jgi:hypothetical protein
MDWYIDFLARTLEAQRVIRTKVDKTEILESSIIRICALWEAFVEDELIDCLNLDSSKFSEYLKLDLPKHLSRSLCEAILIGSRYLDFKSVGDIKGFANKVLPDDVNPFRLIKTNPTAKRIDEVYVMRNYLSHYSSKAKRALRQMYKKSYNLERFREPGDFLLSYAGNRLVPYIEAFLDASKQMRGIITDK